ncbi:CCR4-NOT complex component [Tanacetum coccineum]
MFICPYDHRKAATDIIGWRNVAAKNVHPLLAQKVSKEIGVKKHSPLLISNFSHKYLSMFILYIVIKTGLSSGYHSSKLKHGVGKSNHILSASCMMVGHLAGDLSYVTCKEPLCEKMPTQLRCFVQGLNVASKLLEHAMQLIIDENLESGRESIEKAATDMELSVRRKHREAARHATFDPNLLAQGALLEAFHPQSGDISFFQHQVFR